MRCCILIRRIPLTASSDWQDLIRKKRTPATVVLVDTTSAKLSPHLAMKPHGAVPPAMFADPATRLVDETLSAKLAVFSRLLPISLPFGQSAYSDLKQKASNLVYPHSTFILNMALPSLIFANHTYHILHHHPVPGQEAEDIASLLGAEYHRLVVVGRMRFGFESALPVHLDGVQTVLQCLEKVVTV